MLALYHGCNHWTNQIGLLVVGVLALFHGCNHWTNQIGLLVVGVLALFSDHSFTSLLFSLLESKFSAEVFEPSHLSL